MSFSLPGRACLLYHRQSRISQVIICTLLCTRYFNLVQCLGPIAFKSSLLKPSCHLPDIHRQDLPFRTGFYILRPKLRIGRAFLKVAIAMLMYSVRVDQRDKNRWSMNFLAGIEIDQRMSSPEPSVWPARNLVSPRAYGTTLLNRIKLTMRCKQVADLLGNLDLMMKASPSV